MPEGRWVSGARADARAFAPSSGWVALMLGDINEVTETPGFITIFGIVVLRLVWG